MDDWLTYSLSDFLLFSPRTYYRLFELYNRAAWPGQVLALTLGAAILALLRRGGAWRSRAIAAILAASWLWVGWAYHWQRYATINWAATWYAAAFAAEALLLIWTGVLRGRLRFRIGGGTAAAGLCLFLFALVAQPLIGPLILGRPWAQAELFAIAPDPTAVATLALLVLATGPRWTLTVLPLLWCAVTGLTLWTMGAPDALVTPAAAALAVLLAAWRR